MKVSKLKLNPDKREETLVTSNSVPRSLETILSPMLEGVAFPLNTRIRSLGVLLDLALLRDA